MSENSEIAKIRQDFQFTLSKVSHEVRNPVTLINSFLQMMAQNHPEVEDFEYWDDIIENMEYLKDLLNELSTYNNAHRLEREPVDLAAFVQSIAEALRPTLQYLDIKLEVKCESIHTPLSIDKVKMKQAILNIARNAEEALPPNGTISFCLYQKDNHILLDIGDNGPGIPDEYLPTLFDPFVTHKKEGTGLGLAIARQILEAHGGSILVSTAQNEGTTFTLILPVS